MRWVKVSCPRCESQRLPYYKVWILMAGTWRAFRFRCPVCRVIHVEDCSENIFTKLALHGCPLWAERPLELDEPRGHGGPITHDETLDYLLDLRRRYPLKELS